MSERDLDEGLAQRELLSHILTLATDHGVSPSPWAVLDFLWLAAHLPGGARFETAPKPPPVSSFPLPHPIPPPTADSLPPDPAEAEGPDPPDPRIPICPKFSPTGESGPTVSLPAPLVFPDKRALLQRWRPLMLRGPSRTRKQLDIATTARRWIDERVLEVVERPSSERLVDLMLVLDFGPSMDMWRGLMRELAEAVRTSGGFRRVATACLVGGATPRLVALKDVDNTNANAVQFDAMAASGPRLYLVVTDCISAPWRGKDSLTLLDDWANRGSVAILQVLPERVWSRTALGRAETVQAFTTGALMPNHRLRVLESAADILDQLLAEEENDGSTRGKSVFPCASLLQEGGLSRTIQFLGGRSTSPILCYRFRGGTDAAKASMAPEPIKALEAFTRRASLKARELAKLLAASPAISLPLARIVRKSFLRVKGPPLFEAEIWTSGLLEPMEETAKSDPEEVLYRYREGIQARLLDGAPRSLRQQVIEMTSEFISTHLGRLSGLSAMLANPGENQGKLIAGPGSDPMALVAAEVLQRQGGEIARLADSSVRKRSVADLSRKALQDLYGGERPCHRFAWSPDGMTLAIPTQSGQLTLRPIEAGNDNSLMVSGMGVNQVIWSPDGTRIALACFDRTVRVLDTDRLSEPIKLEGHNSDVTSVAYMPGGELLASGTAGGTVRIWDVPDRGVVALHPARGIGGVRALHWLDGQTLAAGFSERTLIYRYYSSRLVQVQSLAAGGTALASLTRKGSGWLSRSQFLVLGQPNGQLQFWDTQTWQMVQNVFPHTATVTSVDVSSDGRLIASKSRDGSVAALKVSTGRIVASMKVRPTSSPYGSVAFRPGQSTLAVALTDDSEAVEAVGDRDVFLYDLGSLVGTRARKNLRVRVVGSSLHDEGFFKACREIGQELGRCGHALIISSGRQHLADYHAFLGYVESVPYNGRVIFAPANTYRGREYFDTLNSHLAEQLESRKNGYAEIARILSLTFTERRIFDLVDEAMRSATILNSSRARIRQALIDEILSRRSGSILRLERAATIKRSTSEMERGTTVSVSGLELLEGIVATDGTDLYVHLVQAAANRLPGNAHLAGLRELYQGSRPPVRIEYKSTKQERSKEAIQIHAFHDVDALIAIGGDKTTELACRLAAGFNIPTFPIGAFSGSALKYGESLANRLPKWAQADAEEFLRLCNSPWERGAAGHLVRLLERVAIEPRTQGEMPLFVRVRPVPSEPVETSGIKDRIHEAVLRMGVLVHEGLVLTATHSDWPESIPLAVSLDAGVEVLGHEVWNDSTLSLIALSQQLFGQGPFAKLQQLQDGELNDVSIVLASLGKIPTRGVIESLSPDTLEIWIETARPADALGAAVIRNLADGPVVVGVVFARVPSDPCRFRAIRMTLTLKHQIDELLSSHIKTGVPDPTPVQRWVCIAGTGKHELSMVEQDAAVAVGRCLADLSYGLVTGGWPGVDHVCARSFWARLGELGILSPETRLVHVVAADWKPDFPYGQVQRVATENDSYWVSVGRSHAVIVIGGLGGASAVAYAATHQGVPVIPLAGTGGDANILNNAILRSWHDRFPPLPTNARDFERATHWLSAERTSLHFLSALLRSLPLTRHHALPLTGSVLQIERPIEVNDPNYGHGPYVVTRGRHTLKPTPPFRVGIFTVRNIDFARFVAAGDIKIARSGAYIPRVILSQAAAAALAPPPGAVRKSHPGESITRWQASATTK